MPRSFSPPALRTARQAAGLSVAQLAAAVGKSPWALYRIEQGRGHVPVDVADALAEAVGVPLDRLLWADEMAAA